MKKQVLVIGNMRRFGFFLLLYTVFVAAAVFGLCAFVHHMQVMASADAGAALISLAETALLI